MNLRGFEIHRMWRGWGILFLILLQFLFNIYNIATIRNIGKKQNQIMLSLPWQTKIKLLASMSKRTLSLMHYKTRLQYLYMCSLGHKRICPAHGIKHTENIKIGNSGLSTSKNKNAYFFSVGLSPKWYDDGKYHEFLSCFNKYKPLLFYFITLADSHHNTPKTTETSADKPFLWCSSP